ncbi:aminopeptidase [Ornithobacterium rhinotracheale]|uniref:aminopeptidase C n=1 Tax=Ornithobacterium rhinotracheale TaxID=28251 RepID=UPI00129D0EB6|nr:C1 family peptidase [Ornithobacterium rhinotracheale]MRJ07986.1 aminopeptidase [Ornithobacterium rhinotracheale]UOH78504.1 aminopeptidase [Ornithobacterium rhinotracheale]
MKKIFLSLLVGVSVSTFAQEDLINSLKNNKSSINGFVFTPVKVNDATSVKNQGKSGTCWSYSGNSFLESEMLKKGRPAVDLAEIFTARNTYIDKAKNYVRMHGHLNWGDGGELHDVLNAYRKYGALPQEAYDGLNEGQKLNDFGEMQSALKAYLDAIIKNKKLSKNWLNGFTAILDAYLGKVPEKFTYKGKTYTPKTFAKEVVGLNPNDYIEMVSLNDEPKYEYVFFPVPDNWSFDYAYNIPMDDITKVIDYAIEKGYTVGWAADVSEKYFSWLNGVAYVPTKNYEDMSAKERQNMFSAPPAHEREITPEMRQEAFENYETTDDHGMHIVGLAKDQNGNEYYIVKNSWGLSNDYQGYLYVSKNYVKYKTTAIMVNKAGIPKSILKK